MAEVNVRFQWWVPLKGFRWEEEPRFTLLPEWPTIERVQRETVDVRPPWLVGPSTEEVRRSGVTRAFAPITDHPTLHREFAGLPVGLPEAKEAVLRFANRYEMLVGGNVVLSTQVEQGTVIYTGESLFFWRREIQELKDALWLWDAVRERPEDLRRVIRWVGGVPIYMPAADEFWDEYERVGDFLGHKGALARARGQELLEQLVKRVTMKGRCLARTRVIAHDGFHDEYLELWRKKKAIAEPARALLAQLISEKALPAFVWVEIESAAVEVDGCLEVLYVPEPAGGLLHPLDRGVHRLQPRVGDPVS